MHSVRVDKDKDCEGDEERRCNGDESMDDGWVKIVERGGDNVCELRERIGRVYGLEFGHYGGFERGGGWSGGWIGCVEEFGQRDNSEIYDDVVMCIICSRQGEMYSSNDLTWKVLLRGKVSVRENTRIQSSRFKRGNTKLTEIFV